MLRVRPRPQRATSLRLVTVVTLALAAAVLLAACAGGSVAASSRVAVPSVPEAPRWTSQGSVVPTGATAGWVVAPDPASIQAAPGDTNHRPLWVLYRVNGARATDRTPGGITTRGGLTVTAPGSGVAWVGIGSYREDLDGAVAVTTDNGSTWSTGVLPGLFDPVPDGLVATGSRHAWALVGQGSTRSIVATADGGTSWHRVAGAAGILGAEARRCQLSGLGVVGTTLWVGTRCSSPGPAVAAAGPSFGARWQVATVAVHGTGLARPSVTTPPDTGQSGLSHAWTTTGSVLAVESASQGPPAPASLVVTGTFALPAATSVRVSLSGSAGALVTVPQGGSGPGHRPPASKATSEVAVTTDGETHWEVVPTTTGLGGRPEAIGVPAPGTLWVAGSAAKAPALWESTDGGGRWKLVQLPGPDTANGLPAAGS